MKASASRLEGHPTRTEVDPDSNASRAGRLETCIAIRGPMAPCSQHSNRVRKLLVRVMHFWNVFRPIRPTPFSTSLEVPGENFACDKLEDLEPYVSQNGKQVRWLEEI